MKRSLIPSILLVFVMALASCAFPATQQPGQQQPMEGQAEEQQTEGQGEEADTDADEADEEETPAADEADEEDMEGEEEEAEAEETPVAATEDDEEPVVIKVSTAPDPNSLPIILLEAKEDEWIPGIDIQIVTTPPGASDMLRDLVDNQEVDVALMNMLSAVDMQNDGADLRLAGVHVWRAVCLLAQEDIEEASELDGEQILAVPGMNTPPRVLAQKALELEDTEVEFEAMVPNQDFWALISDAEEAPLAIAAPEPMASFILGRQEAEDWDVRYSRFINPQQVLSPETAEVPLTGVWVVNTDMPMDDPDSLQTFMQGMIKTANYMSDPDTFKEAAGILSEGFDEMFDVQAKPAIFEDLLESGRVVVDFRAAPTLQGSIADMMDTFYDVEFNEDTLCQGVSNMRQDQMHEDMMQQRPNKNQDKDKEKGQGQGNGKRQGQDNGQNTSQDDDQNGQSEDDEDQSDESDESGEGDEDESSEDSNE